MPPTTRRRSLPVTKTLAEVEALTPASKVTKALDWVYRKATHGIPGLDSASELAGDYLKGSGTLTDRVNRLIRWQNTKAATSGFVTGFGGAIVLPLTIPANVASVMYVQLRMVAAIAIMGGHDIRDDRVKTVAYACLTGNGLKDIFKDAGIALGKGFAKSAIKKISGKKIIAINQKVGFRLLTKAGETGIVNLGKIVPFLGGVIGGVVDATTTNVIGNVARNTFIEDKCSDVNPSFKRPRLRRSA